MTFNILRKADYIFKESYTLLIISAIKYVLNSNTNDNQIISNITKLLKSIEMVDEKILYPFL